MEPSVWQEIDTGEINNTIGVYALIDAFYQFKDKFDKEMKTCGLATGPITFIGAWKGEKATLLTADQYTKLQTAVARVWKNADILPLSEFVVSNNDILLQNKKAQALKSGYAAIIHILSSKSSLINLIDLNFNYYSLLRLVMRDEMKLFIRIIDRNGMPVFVEEFEVSPTFIADPLISPIGGFLIRLEKNTSRPLVVDFGPIEEQGKHVLRFNSSFRQPFAVPPLAEFIPAEMLKK